MGASIMVHGIRSVESTFYGSGESYTDGDYGTVGFKSKGCFDATLFIYSKAEAEDLIKALKKIAGQFSETNNQEPTP